MKVPYQLLRAARVALDITHEDLAKEAGVSKRTLVRIERPQGVSEDSIARVRAALEARGVEFLPPEDGQGPGIRVPEAALKDPASASMSPREKGRILSGSNGDPRSSSLGDVGTRVKVPNPP